MDVLGLALDRWLALVIAAVALSGFMRGFVGFGAALVSVPILSLVLGPKTAIAVTGVMGLPALVQLLPEAIRGAERPLVLPIGIATFLAAPVGTLLLVTIDPALMKIAISGLVLAMVAMLASGWQVKGEVGPLRLLVAGVVGGLIQGSAGMGGPPVVAVVLARAGNAVQQRANVLALMTVMSLSSLLPLVLYGLMTRRAVLIGALLFPVYSLTTWFGSRYFAVGGQAYYRRAAIGMLACVGLATLAIALRGYFAG